MPSPYKLLLHNESLWLSHERCIFWERERSLILSDLHLGKTGHFRKSGIAVPQNIYKEDLHRLLAQIQYFNATSLIIVGDLFHSSANKEMDLFLKWRKDLASIKIELIKGNHDILSKMFYTNAAVNVSDKHWLKDPFCFTHDITLKCNNEIVKDNYTFSGHIHPGIKINGLGRQSLKFPCFSFSKEFAVLPAFSRFTGLTSLRPEAGDQIFAIIENNLLQIQ